MMHKKLHFIILVKFTIIQTGPAEQEQWGQFTKLDSSGDERERSRTLMSTESGPWGLFLLSYLDRSNYAKTIDLL